MCDLDDKERQVLQELVDMELESDTWTLDSIIEDQTHTADSLLSVTAALAERQTALRGIREKL